MSQIRHEISAVKIEYVCDRCGQGVYRLEHKRPITTDYVLKCQHRRNHGGDPADFTVPYLVAEVDGKPVSRMT